MISTNGQSVSNDIDTKPQKKNEEILKNKALF